MLSCEALGSLQIDIASPHQINLCTLLLPYLSLVKCHENLAEKDIDQITACTKRLGLSQLKTSYFYEESVHLAKLIATKPCTSSALLYC